jgi:hypothetical protein
MCGGRQSPQSGRRSEPASLCHQLTDSLLGKDVRLVPPSTRGQETVRWRLDRVPAQTTGLEGLGAEEITSEWQVDVQRVLPKIGTPSNMRSFVFSSSCENRHPLKCAVLCFQQFAGFFRK